MLSAAQQEELPAESAVEFSEDDLEEIQVIPEDLQKAGEVYYDPETGAYYIVNDAG